MKLLTLIISARAYGVETLLELAILEQLSRPDHYEGLPIKSLSLNLGDKFEACVNAVAHLENINLIRSRRGRGRSVLQSVVLTLSDNGKRLMYGNPTPDTNPLTLATA